MKEPEAINVISDPSSDLELGNDAQKIAKKSKERPDGTDISRYKGHEKWPYRRWAWEFLRRNELFIEACDEIRRKGASDNEKQKIASQFGLKKFKAHDWKYRGKGGIPVFSIGSIVSWSNTVTNKEDTKTVQIRLNSGQLAIRFDVASAAEDPHRLNKQLRNAEMRLKKRLAQYKQDLEHEFPSHRNRVSTFLTLLRVLDARKIGKTHVECELLVSPHKEVGFDPFKDIDQKRAIQQAGYKKDTKAKTYANELYKFLAVKKGYPSKEKSKK